MPFNSSDPLGYLGIKKPQQPIFIEVEGAPTTEDMYQPGTQWMDISVDPPVIYETVGGGVWYSGSNAEATTTTPGIVTVTDNNMPVATQFYVDTAIAGVVVGAVPPATTTTSGIGKLVSDANAVARIPSTGVQAYFVQPSNLTAVMSAPGPIGDVTPSTGAFTDLSATGTISFPSGTGGTFIVPTGDLTLEATAGSLIMTAGESATDAIKMEATAGGIQILASGAAAGEDIVVTATGSSVRITSTESATDAINVEATLGGINILASGAAAGEDINITSTGSSIRLTATESATDAINIEATTGGINILASGAAAGEDINVTATGSSVNITSTENAALSIYLHENGGASGQILLRADQGTAADSISLLSDVGGVTLSGGLATADAINIVASDVAGGIDIDAGTGGIAIDTSGALVVTSTQNSAASIFLHANGGTSETIRLHADQGTGVASVQLLSDVGGITLSAGLSTADAINLTAGGVAGGIDVDSGTGGFIVDTTGAVSLDSALASNLTVTGVADLTLSSVGGSVVITGTEAAVDAVQINATTALGGVDINAGTGGITVDSGGLMSLDAAGAVNLTTTGAFDITVNSTAGSIVITGAEAAADAIDINASDVAGGIDVDAGTGGIAVDTTGAISLDSATASNFTVTGAADLTLASTAGAVNVTSGEANADSINVTSAGGMNIVATGAAAKDTIVTNTNGSMTFTAGENVTDAMNITASGAASRVNVTAGTGSIKLASGLIVQVANKANADTPYTVLGTDYFIACDTSAGVLTVTLPAASSVTGRTYVIRDVGGAAAVNNITIGGGGTNLVGGGAAAATKVLSANYSGATVISNGTVWAYSYVA